MSFLLLFLILLEVVMEIEADKAARLGSSEGLWESEVELKGNKYQQHDCERYI